MALLFCMPTANLAMSRWVPSYVSNYFKSEKDRATDALIALIEELPEPMGPGARRLPGPEKLTRIQSLLAAGADPNARIPDQRLFKPSDGTISLLTKLAYKNAPEATELLLKAGARPNDPSEVPPLFIAIEYCYEDVIALLIKYGADVNKSLPESGQTPLMTARNCELGVWKLLLKNGANPNTLVNNRNTFLMNTVSLNANRSDKYDMAKVLKTLAEYNTNLDLQNGLGITALMLAADKTDISSIEGLLAHGANPNIQDKKGETALFKAIRRGVTEPVAFLIRAGTDLSITNIDGDSALSVAKGGQADLRGNMNYDEARKGRLIKQFDEIIEMLQNPTKVKRTTRNIYKIK